MNRSKNALRHYVLMKHRGTSRNVSVCLFDMKQQRFALGYGYRSWPSTNPVVVRRYFDWKVSLQKRYTYFTISSYKEILNSRFIAKYYMHINFFGRISFTRSKKNTGWLSWKVRMKRNQCSTIHHIWILLLIMLNVMPRCHFVNDGCIHQMTKLMSKT